YEAEMLAQFPAAFHHYAQRRVGAAGIRYLPRTAFVRQDGGDIVLRGRDGGGEYRLPSDLTLLCLGVKPSPMALETNIYGQIKSGGDTLDSLFAAGDCARFDGPGANTRSAQVALRKGQTAAGNILANRLGKPMQTYDYREQGYLVSLGPHDAIGWIDQPDNIITGITAATVKAAVEKRYDGLLAGIYAPILLS
ncbi:MAG: FAD-dependent oxidoreductase, partial [Candidatus Methylumidiphilus sp.]